MKKHFVVGLLLLISIYLSSYAEISTYEFMINPDTPCALGGNFKLIEEKSLKPALFIYSCGKDYRKNAAFLVNSFKSNLESGQLLLAIIPSVGKPQLQDKNKVVFDYINKKYSMSINKQDVFEIRNVTFSSDVKTQRQPHNKTKINRHTDPELVLTPKEGCLPVKFGMNREQIVEILGKPDQYLGKNCLDYSSTIGLSLLVHSKKGLLAMDCWSQNEKSNEGLICGSTFVGKFSNGVTIGSTREEVEKAFGKKSGRNDSSIASLSYPTIGTVFTMTNGKVTHISMNKPR